jgi:hypothetical protein
MFASEQASGCRRLKALEEEKRRRELRRFFGAPEMRPRGGTHQPDSTRCFQRVGLRVFHPCRTARGTLSYELQSIPTAFTSEKTNNEKLDYHTSGADPRSCRLYGGPIETCAQYGTFGSLQGNQRARNLGVV